MAGKGSTTQRGYGTPHQKLRKRWQARIDSGEEVVCWRCAEQGEPHPILPGDAWDLGHDDTDRGRYRGPECVAGNRATNGRSRDIERNSRVW